MRQLLSLLILVPFALLVLAVVGVLAPVIRLAFRVGVAGLATLIAGLAGAHGWTLLAVFAGTLLLLSLSDRRPRRRPVPAARRVIDNAAPPEPATAQPGPAWRELRGLADWRTRRRLDAAWDACARYMAVADAHEDASAQLPIKIAKHLPAIVADCVRHSRTATADERRALIGEVLDTFETLAGRAEERRRALAHDAQAGYRTLRTHLNNPDD